MSDRPYVTQVEEGAVTEGAVRGYIHFPATSTGVGLVLTHGAGANCESPLLVSLATVFCESGITVLRCDLPFRQLRPHGPPARGNAKLDQMGLRRAVEMMRQQVSDSVYLGGHSYGGRQGSMLAASEPGLIDTLLLLSYPLHPPTRPSELRTAHFPGLHTPALFVHGTRDAFGTIDELNEARKLISARTELFPVEGAGHELMSARTRSQLAQKIASAFGAFIESNHGKP